MALTNRHEELRRELNIKQLMQRAQEKTDLSDYGDNGFVKPLGKFLDCCARDTNFHAAGLKEFKEVVVRDLVNRLRFQHDLKLHPEILEEDVSDPIIILGLPRSGTTKTQRMVSTDANLLKTYTWQLLNPAPFPNAVSGQPDPRIAAACVSDYFAEGHPEVHAAHHMAAEQVEEDWELFAYSFNDWCRLMRNPTRSWHDWVMGKCRVHSSHDMDCEDQRNQRTRSQPQPINV